jgi:hypothetical protein
MSATTPTPSCPAVSGGEEEGKGGGATEVGLGPEEARLPGREGSSASGGAAVGGSCIPMASLRVPLEIHRREKEAARWRW